ncbi:TIM-barrel domain-containing protein [Conexibacter sp. DBS9H8]|uniref:TIM-barrel domain-containing protein n=1 Tax=Conexibacter sp. DBS9H8 TaxID=2937801 RepID=UPI00200DEA21|nr:TIM-barrel domain-containing protein [Conexibacter sp. DBS9H8]
MKGGRSRARGRRATAGAVLAGLIPLAGCLALPGSARAALTLTPTEIVLSTPGATVTVQRDPFALSFSTGTGRAVLSETGAGTVVPKLVPASIDPLPPGTEPARSGELYAPLSFLVGTATVQQYNGLVWGGNLLSGLQAGVEYSAREVTGVARDGSGVSLTVATTDPTGRTLHLSIAPDGSGLLQVAVTPDPATGVAMMSDAFSSPPGEAFYGFGGRHNALNQRGQALQSFVEEENVAGISSAPLGSPATVLFPNGPSAAYYPQAEFFSSAGYGFLLAQPELAFFRMDSDTPNAWSVATEAPSLRYVVAPGRAPTAIADLTRRSGRQPVPPRWALGPMLDRLVKNVGESRSNYQSELEQDMTNIVRYRLPLTAYRIEGWGFPGSGNDGLSLPTFVSAPVQARIIARLRALHIHPLAYLRPWITPGSAPDRAGYTVKNAQGRTYVTTSTAGTPIALLDFTNPAAVRWWKGQIDKVLNLGFDGFMSDFGEEILADMHFHDGETGLSMHNRYPVLYQEANRQAVNAYMRAHPGRRIWFFNRAGYSGTPGSAAYEGGNFPGDETTNWGQASGLASLTPDMLNRAVDGAFGYGTDIGGYYDITTPPTTKALFLRWAEWAALSPIFRLHGAGLTGTHTPWSFDAQTVRVYDALSRLHERAVPLILALWREGDRTGIPPTRPLWLQFPGDAAAAAQEQEWMLGPHVLVAPVVSEGATARSVVFPPGCWEDPVSHRRVRGPLTRTVTAPLTALPYFFSCGTDPFRLPRTRRRRR